MDTPTLRKLASRCTEQGLAEAEKHLPVINDIQRKLVNVITSEIDSLGDSAETHACIQTAIGAVYMIALSQISAETARNVAEAAVEGASLLRDNVSMPDDIKAMTGPHGHA